MKMFLKSNFFWTKVLPTVFFCILMACMMYPPTFTIGWTTIGILPITVLLLNLHIKKDWISQIVGVIFVMIFFYLVFAVLSEYREFPDGTTFDALRLLLVGLALCFTSMTMGVLLCLPFKVKERRITKQPKALVLLVVMVMLITSACDRRPCKNTNPVFDRYSPSDNEYKTELVKQMQITGAHKLEYWFDNYLEKNGREYMLVYIQGNGLCAKGEVLMNEWHKLEGIRKTRGKGYRGAKLKGLELDIRKDSTTIELVYKNVAGIID